MAKDAWASSQQVCVLRGHSNHPYPCTEQLDLPVLFYASMQGEMVPKNANLMQAPGVVLVVVLRAKHARDSATSALTCSTATAGHNLPCTCKVSGTGRCRQQHLLCALH